MQAADWARRNWPWSAGLAWAWWQPPQPVGDPHWGFALVDSSGDAMPALASLETWSATAHPLGAGIWPPDDAAVNESGGWRLTGQAADPPHGAAGEGNTLTVEFEGTGLALQVQRGPYWGYLDVTVDGEPANALPQDADGKAYLVLHDPLGGQELVTIADGLADGTHRAELHATGGWEQWPVQGFVVSKETAQRWPVPLGWILGIAGSVAGGRRRGRTGDGRDDGAIATRSGQSLFAVLDRTPVAGRYAVLVVVWIGVIALTGWLQLLALGLLFLLFVAFPETGLFSLAVRSAAVSALCLVAGQAVSPAELTVWLLVGALVVRAAGRHVAASPARPSHWRLRFNVRGLDWPVLALLVVAALSLITAQNFGVAAREFRTVIVAGVLTYAAVRLAPATRGWAFRSLAGGLGPRRRRGNRRRLGYRPGAQRRRPDRCRGRVAGARALRVAQQPGAVRGARAACHAGGGGVRRAPPRAVAGQRAEFWSWRPGCC